MPDEIWLVRNPAGNLRLARVVSQPHGKRVATWFGSGSPTPIDQLGEWKWLRKINLEELGRGCNERMGSGGSE